MMLTPEEAAATYDRIGRLQDSQSLYEEPAVRRLLSVAAPETAHTIFEIGCGTGRIAVHVLSALAPADATYACIDVSPKMVEIASGRLTEFGDRARVELSDGAPRIDAGDSSVDLVMTTYVFDLLPVETVRAWLEEAHRVLRPDGRLAHCGLTYGTDTLSRTVSGVWRRIHSRLPRLVGGCRPIDVSALVDAAHWSVEHRSVVVSWGIPSEVLVATPA